MEDAAKNGRPWFSYIGGSVAGIGLGILLGAYLAERGVFEKGFDPLVMIACFLLISIGSFLNSYGLRSRK
jgi:hypothetical protein